MQSNNIRLEVEPEMIWGPVGSQPTRSWNPFDEQRVSTNPFLQNPQPQTPVGHIAVLTRGGQDQSTTTTPSVPARRPSAAHLQAQECTPIPAYVICFLPRGLL